MCGPATVIRRDSAESSRFCTTQTLPKRHLEVQLSKNTCTMALSVLSPPPPPNKHSWCANFSYLKCVDPSEVVANAVDSRGGDRTLALTAEEEKVVADRIRGVLTNLAELRFMLATAVERWERREGRSRPARNCRLAATSPRRCMNLAFHHAGFDAQSPRWSQDRF